MSDANSKTIQQYCKAVKKELSCPGKIKKDLIIRLTPDLEMFAEENPNASLDDISAHFGSPKEVAESYLASLDEEELKKRINKAKRIWIAVIAVCAAILLLFIAMMVRTTIHNQNGQLVYYEKTISEGETIYLD